MTPIVLQNLQNYPELYSISFRKMTRIYPSIDNVSLTSIFRTAGRLTWSYSKMHLAVVYQSIKEIRCSDWYQILAIIDRKESI